MTDNVKVAISSDFLTAFARLPRQVQGKVTEFVNKFRNNPMSPGINYEKLNSGIKRNKVDDRSFDGLRVATMHRVKGLEFKYVFIAAVNNRIIPMPSAINKTDVVSEAESITSEKCLLYVAMTRAQKGVYITSYGRPSEFLG